MASEETEAKRAVRDSYSGFSDAAMMDTDRITTIDEFERVSDDPPKFKYTVKERETFGSSTTESTFEGKVRREGDSWEVDPHHRT